MPETESVHVTRRITAKPQEVFNCWVDGALLEKWLAPAAKADPRQGGHFELKVTSPEGAHVVAGEYREFVPGRRLVMTWVYSGPMIPDGKMDSLVTVNFIPDGENTEIDLLHEHLTNPRYRQAIQSGAWPKALDSLEQHLTK